MKKIFDFEETVKYMHSIEVDIDEEQEDEFEDFADTIACDIEENGDSIDRHWIASAFIKEFGEDKVKFSEDGSPTVEFEVI